MLPSSLFWIIAFNRLLIEAEASLEAFVSFRCRKRDLNFVIFIPRQPLQKDFRDENQINNSWCVLLSNRATIQLEEKRKRTKHSMIIQISYGDSLFGREGNINISFWRSSPGQQWLRHSEREEMHRNEFRWQLNMATCQSQSDSFLQKKTRESWNYSILLKFHLEDRRECRGKLATAREIFYAYCTTLNILWMKSVLLLCDS